MSNFVGYFKGTGAVNNQPNESKIKVTSEVKKNIEYVKLGIYCENAFHDISGDIKEKRIEVERVVGIDENFDWLPLQKYLKKHCNGAEKILGSTGDSVKCEANWYRILTHKTADAVVLDKNNLQDQVNGIIGDFCHAFNRNMGTTKKLHTKPFDVMEYTKDTTPTL